MEPLRKQKQNFQVDNLRTIFKDNLTKLIQISTRQQGIKQLKSLIMQNKTTSNLRIWLSVLFENRQKHNESEILILYFIIQNYGKGMIDPLDKIPSLEKTVFRVTELITKFFKDQHQNVTLACQRAWVQLYLTCLNDQQCQIKKRLVYDQLEAIINGGADRISQTTAFFVLDGILEASMNKEDHVFFKEIAKRTLVLFLKTTINHPSTLTSFQTIISYFNILNLLPLLESLSNKILFYASSATNTSTGYKIKAQACNCLALIGQQIDNNGISVIDKVMKVLENMATDKVWAVQVTGRKAFAIWKKKKQEWDLQYFKKQQQYVEAQSQQKWSKPQNKQSDIKYRTHQNNWIGSKKQIDSYPTQQQFYKPQQEISPKLQQNIQNNFEERSMLQQPERWNHQNQNRNSERMQSNYLQKNTGIGGGNSALSVENYYDRQKMQSETYHKKMEQIKKSLYDPKKEDLTEYDETIPWDQAKQLPKVIPKTRLHKITQSQTSSVQGEQCTNEIDTETLKSWQQIIELHEKGKIQESVKLLLAMDDDIYFLRYLLKYGKGVLQNLTRQTTSKVLKQMLQIKKAHFMEQLFFKLVGESSKVGIGQFLTNHKNAEILNKLQKCQTIHGLQKISTKLKKNYQKSLDN